MSTSILYHAFGIAGYDFRKTRFEAGTMVFEIAHKESHLRCPSCLCSSVTCRGTFLRRFRTLPVGGRSVFIELAVQRVECGRCQAVRQVEIGFADERLSYTKRFRRYVLELLRYATIQDVARHLGVSWDLVKGIQKVELTRRFSRPSLKSLRRLAIDEIAVLKGHKYLTVVMDLDSGAVVFVGDSKGHEALDPFWRMLGRRRTKIEAVATDMGLPYLFAVRENLPNAVHVLDHFHVVKSLNDKLSDLRRQLYREATDVLQKKVLKGTRWLLLKNPDNLETSKREDIRLQEALRLNEPLAIAYYLKEDLRTLWAQPSKQKAEKSLDLWIRAANASGIRVLQTFANTLQTHRTAILAYYDYPISTGPLEGMNNKIKTMKRMAYGFRDMDFFKLRIKALHETKYALVG